MAKPSLAAAADGDKPKKKGFSLLNKTKASVVSRNLIPFSRRKVAKPLADKMSMTVQPPIQSVSFTSGSPESRKNPTSTALADSSDNSQSNGNISDDTKISSLTDRDGLNAAAERRRQEALARSVAVAKVEAIDATESNQSGSQGTSSRSSEFSYSKVADDKNVEQQKPPNNGSHQNLPRTLDPTVDSSARSYSPSSNASSDESSSSASSSSSSSSSTSSCIDDENKESPTGSSVAQQEERPRNGTRTDTEVGPAKKIAFEKVKALLNRVNPRALPPMPLLVDTRPQPASSSSPTSNLQTPRVNNTTNVNHYVRRVKRDPSPTADMLKANPSGVKPPGSSPGSFALSPTTNAAVPKEGPSAASPGTPSLSPIPIQRDGSDVLRSMSPEMREMHDAPPTSPKTPTSPSSLERHAVDAPSDIVSANKSSLEYLEAALSPRNDTSLVDSKVPAISLVSPQKRQDSPLIKSIKKREQHVSSPPFPEKMVRPVKQIQPHGSTMTEASDEEEAPHLKTIVTIGSQLVEEEERNLAHVKLQQDHSGPASPKNVNDSDEDCVKAGIENVGSWSKWFRETLDPTEDKKSKDSDTPNTLNEDQNMMRELAKTNSRVQDSNIRTPKEGSMRDRIMKTSVVPRISGVATPPPSTKTNPFEDQSIDSTSKDEAVQFFAGKSTNPFSPQNMITQDESGLNPLESHGTERKSTRETASVRLALAGTNPFDPLVVEDQASRGSIGQQDSQIPALNNKSIESPEVKTEAYRRKTGSESESKLTQICGINPFDNANDVSKNSPRKAPVVSNPFDRMVLPMPVKTNPFDDTNEQKCVDARNLAADGDESSDDGIPVPVVDAEVVMAALEKTLTGLIPSSNPASSPHHKGKGNRKRGEPLSETNAIQTAVNQKATVMAEKHVASAKKLSPEEARALARQAINRSNQRKLASQQKKAARESQHDQNRPSQNRKQIEGNLWLPGEIYLSKDDTVSEWDHSVQHFPVQQMPDSPASRALYDIEEMDRYATVEATPLKGVHSFESDGMDRDRYAPINEAPTINDTPVEESNAREALEGKESLEQIEETTAPITPKEEGSRMTDKDSLLDEVSEWTTNSPETGDKAIELILKGSTVEYEPSKENQATDIDSFDEALNLVLGGPNALTSPEPSRQCDASVGDLASLGLQMAESTSVSGAGFELTVSEHLQALAHRITTSGNQKPLETIKEPSTGKTVDLFWDPDEVSKSAIPSHVQEVREEKTADETNDIRPAPISSSGKASSTPLACLGFFSTTPRHEQLPLLTQSDPVEPLEVNAATASSKKLRTKPYPPQAPRHKKTAQNDTASSKPQKVSKMLPKTVASPRNATSPTPALLTPRTKTVQDESLRTRPAILSLMHSADSSYDDGGDICRREPSGLEVITAYSTPVISTVPAQDPVGRSPLDLNLLRPDPDESAIARGSSDIETSAEHPDAPETYPDPPQGSALGDNISSSVDSSAQDTDDGILDSILNDSSTAPRSRAVEMEKLVLYLRAEGMKPSKVKQILTFGQNAANLSPQSRLELEKRMERLNTESQKILKKSIVLAKSKKEKKSSEGKKSSEPELIDLTSINTYDDLAAHDAVWLFDLSPKNKDGSSKSPKSADVDSMIANHFFRSEQRSEDPATLDSVIEFASKMSGSPASRLRVWQDIVKSKNGPTQGSPTRAGICTLDTTKKETRDAETQVGTVVAADTLKITGDVLQVVPGLDAPQISMNVERDSNTPSAGGRAANETGESTGDVLVVVQGTDVMAMPVPVLGFPLATDAQPFPANIMMENPYALPSGNIPDPWTYQSIFPSESHGFTRPIYHQHASPHPLDKTLPQKTVDRQSHQFLAPRRTNVEPKMDAPSNHRASAFTGQDTVEESNIRRGKKSGAPFPGGAQLIREDRANTISQNSAAPTPEVKGSRAGNRTTKGSSQVMPGEDEEPIWYSKRVGRDNTAADDDVDFCDVLGEVLQSFDITENFKEIESENKPFSQALGAISPSHSSTSIEDQSFRPSSGQKNGALATHRRPTPEKGRSRQPNARSGAKSRLANAPLTFHGALRKTRTAQAQNDQHIFDYFSDEILRPGIRALHQALSGEEEPQRPTTQDTRTADRLIRKRPTPEGHIMRSRLVVRESQRQPALIRRTYSAGEDPVDSSSESVGSGPTFSVGEDPICRTDRIACDTRSFTTMHSLDVDYLNDSDRQGATGRRSASKVDASPSGGALNDVKAVDPEPAIKSHFKAVDPEPTDSHSKAVDPEPTDSQSYEPTINKTATDNANDLRVLPEKRPGADTVNAAESYPVQTSRDDVQPTSPSTLLPATSPKATNITKAETIDSTMDDIHQIDQECEGKMTASKATGCDVNSRPCPAEVEETMKEANDKPLKGVPTVQNDSRTFPEIDCQRGNEVSTPNDEPLQPSTSGSRVAIIIEESKPEDAPELTMPALEQPLSSPAQKKTRKETTSPSTSDVVVNRDFLDAFFEGAEFMVCGVRDRRNAHAFNSMAGITSPHSNPNIIMRKSPKTKQRQAKVEAVNEKKDLLDRYGEAVGRQACSGEGSNSITEQSKLNLMCGAAFLQAPASSTLAVASEKDILDRYGEVVERSICAGPSDLRPNQRPTTLLAVQEQLNDRYGEAIDRQPTLSNDSGVVGYVHTAHMGVQTEEQFPTGNDQQLVGKPHADGGIKSCDLNLSPTAADQKDVITPPTGCESNNVNPDGSSGEKNVAVSAIHNNNNLPPLTSFLHDTKAPPPPPPPRDLQREDIRSRGSTTSASTLTASTQSTAVVEREKSPDLVERIGMVLSHESQDGRPLSKDFNANGPESKPPLPNRRHSINEHETVGAVIPERPFLLSTHAKTAAPVPEQRLVRNKALIDLADSASNVGLSVVGSEDSAADLNFTTTNGKKPSLVPTSPGPVKSATKKLISNVESIEQRETIEVALGNTPRTCNTNMNEGETAKVFPGRKGPNDSSKNNEPGASHVGLKKDDAIDEHSNEAVRGINAGFAATSHDDTFVVVEADEHEHELALAATCSDDVTLVLQVDHTTGEPYLAPVEKISSGLQKDDSRDPENGSQGDIGDGQQFNILSGLYGDVSAAIAASLKAIDSIGGSTGLQENTAGASTSLEQHRGRVIHDEDDSGLSATSSKNTDYSESDADEDSELNSGLNTISASRKSQMTREESANEFVASQTVSKDRVMLQPVATSMCSQGTQTVNDQGTQTIMISAKIDEGDISDDGNEARLSIISASTATVQRDFLIKEAEKRTPAGDAEISHVDEHASLTFDRHPVTSQATSGSESEFDDAEKVVSEVLAMNKVVTEMLAMKSFSPRATREMDLQLRFESEGIDPVDSAAASEAVVPGNGKLDIGSQEESSGVQMYQAESTSGSKSTPGSESDSESRLFQALLKSISLADASVEKQLDAVIHVNSRCESEVIEMNIVSDDAKERAQLMSNISCLSRDDIVQTSSTRHEPQSDGIFNPFSGQEQQIVKARTFDVGAPRPECMSKQTPKGEKSAVLQRSSTRNAHTISKTQSDGILNHISAQINTRSFEVSGPRPEYASKQTPKEEKFAVLQKSSATQPHTISKTQSDVRVNYAENNRSVQVQKIKTTRSGEIAPRPESINKQTLKGEKGAVLHHMSIIGRDQVKSEKPPDGAMNYLISSEQNILRASRSAEIAPRPESIIKQTSKGEKTAMVSTTQHHTPDRKIRKTRSVEVNALGREPSLTIHEQLVGPRYATGATGDDEATSDNEIGMSPCSILVATSSEGNMQENTMGEEEERVSNLSSTDLDESKEAWSELQHGLLRLSLSAPEQRIARDGLSPLSTAAAEASALSSLSFNATEPLPMRSTDASEVSNFSIIASDASEGTVSEMRNGRPSPEKMEEMQALVTPGAAEASSSVLTNSGMSTNDDEGASRTPGAEIDDATTLALGTASDLLTPRGDPPSGRVTPSLPPSVRGRDPPSIESAPTLDTVMLSTVFSMMTTTDESGNIQSVDKSSCVGGTEPNECLHQKETFEPEQTMEGVEVTVDSFIPRSSMEDQDCETPSSSVEAKQPNDNSLNVSIEHSVVVLENNDKTLVDDGKKPSASDKKQDDAIDPEQRKFDEMAKALAELAGAAREHETPSEVKPVAGTDQTTKAEKLVAEEKQDAIEESTTESIKTSASQPWGVFSWNGDKVIPPRGVKGMIPFSTALGPLKSNIGEDAKMYMAAAAGSVCETNKIYLVSGTTGQASGHTIYADESKKLLASAAVGLTQALGPPGVSTALPHENSNEGAKDTNDTASSIDHSHDETRTSTQIAESSAYSATDNSHDYSTSVTYSKASHAPTGSTDRPSIIHRRFSSYTGTGPFCFAGLPQLFQPPKVQKASTAIEEAERLDESSRSIPTSGLRVVNRSKKGTPAEMDLEVVQVQPKKDAGSASSKQDAEDVHQREDDLPIHDEVASSSRFSKADSHTKSKSSRSSQSSRNSKVSHVAGYAGTSIPMEIDVEQHATASGSSQPSVKTMTPTSISSASSPNRQSPAESSRASGEQKISRFGSDIGEMAISGPPSRSTASVARSCGQSLGPISESSPSEAQLSSIRVPTFSRSKDDDSCLLLALTRSEAEPTLALLSSSGSSGSSQAESSTTENDKLHIDPALWGSIAMSDQDSTSSSPHKVFLASRENSSKDFYKGESLISNVERANILSRVEKVRAMVDSPRTGGGVASPCSADTSYGYKSHHSSHDSESSTQSSHDSPKLHQTANRSAESSIPRARPMTPSRSFVRSTRLQTVLDRLRNRQPLRISDSQSVTSSEIDNVDVDELFSRYDDIVKHMVVTDKDRLERVKERQASENQHTDSDQGSHATESVKEDYGNADSAYPAKSSDALKASSRESQSYRSSPIIDVTALGSASHDTGSEIGSRAQKHKPASLKGRTSSFGSASEHSATPSEKARELRRQLDQALRTSVAIRSTQERLNSEISSFKSRLQQQRSSIPGTDSGSITDGRMYSFDQSHGANAQFSTDPAASRYSPNVPLSHATPSFSESRATAPSPYAYGTSPAVWDTENCIVIDDAVPTFQAGFMQQHHQQQQQHHHQMPQQQRAVFSNQQENSPHIRSMIDGMQEQDENSASSTDDEEAIRLRQLDSIIHGLRSAQRF